MTINELPDIVYHGTISIHKDSLLSGIDVAKGYKSADFGQGFYTTSNYEQAKKLAIDRTNIYNKRYNPSMPAKPLIIKYRVDKAKLLAFKGLLFETPDDKWKEFIFNNRVGIDFLVSTYYNKDGKYNFVYGCVADSNITEMIGDVRKNNLTFGDFFDSLKPLKQIEYDQLSFHTNDAAMILNLIDFDILEMEAILNE